MAYIADAYDDTQPTGATLAMYIDEELRAAKGALIDHRDRIAELENSEGTELVRGLMRLATDAEFSDANGAHPATPEQILAHVNSAVGVQVSFNIGAVHFRIGTTALAATQDTPIVFDEAFTTSMLGVWFSRKALISGAEGVSLLYRAESRTGFTITHHAPGTPYEICWIAAGL